MDLPLSNLWTSSALTILSSLYYGTAAFSVVFVSLTIYRQATKYTSGMTPTLALSILLSLWALFRADNMLYSYQNGIHSPVLSLAMTRGENSWLPRSINKGKYYLKVHPHEYAWDRWWNYQMCSFMIGSWNIFLVTEGQQNDVEFLWAFILLGGTASLPLASNLFHLALLLSPKGRKRLDGFVSPHLWASTALSLCILARLLLNSVPPWPQTLAILHFLPLVPLIRPPSVYPTLSVHRKWLYHSVHVVSAATLIPTLLDAIGTIRLVDFHSASVYPQWFTSILAHVQRSSAAQDLLITSISFAALIFSQSPFRSSNRVMTAACFVIGTPFLNTISALVLGLLAGGARSDDDSMPPTPPSSMGHSTALLLRKLDIWWPHKVDRHLLWTKNNQIYHTKVSTHDEYDLDDLVGDLIPDTEVYGQWRDFIREASNPPSPTTFVKYSYVGPITKIFENIDPFVRLYDEIAILEEISKAAHPNIVEYFGCLRRGDLIVGICLRKYVCTLGAFVDGKVPVELRPPYDPIVILSDIRAGLDFLHSLSLVHDDINPRNIMLDENGRAIIIDFDSCRRIGAPSAGGTPGWATNPAMALIENDEYGLSLSEKFMHGEYDGQDLTPYENEN